MNLTELLYSWQYHSRLWLAGFVHSRLGRREGRPDVPGQPERVLLIITGLIGDTVMSTPVIPQARRTWPKAKITVLGLRHTCALLSACPFVDECKETPVIPFQLRRRSKIKELTAWLRAGSFDLAIIVMGDQFAPVLARVGIPVRVGVRGHVLESFLTHTYDFGSPREWGPSQRLNAFRALGYEVEEEVPRLWVSAAARAQGQKRLSALLPSAHAAYAIIHPFGSTPRQWWPLERVGPLAERLRKSYGLAPVVTGGPATRGRLPPAVSEHAVDGTGVFSLEELLAVVQGAQLVVSTDSGPFHIAGALDRPTVGLFRARRPEHAGYYPRGSVVFGRDEACEKYCRWNRCRELPCRQLASLTVAEVLRTIDQLMTDPAARS